MGDSTTGMSQKLKEIVRGLCSCTRNSVEKKQLCDRCSGVRITGPCAGKENGSCCCTPNGLPSPLCVYYSPRFMGLLKGEKTESEFTREHWTALDPQEVAEAKRIGDENRKYFDEVLAKHPQWGAFFTRFKHLKLGEKIGEGAQAEIFEATTSPRLVYERGTEVDLVAKVWKVGVSLKDLEQQWPPQMMSKLSQGSHELPFKNIYGGVFIGKRLAFVMKRYVCDLRTHIDRQMLKTHGPPFKSIQHVYQVLFYVAYDLVRLHEAGVVHRDIKASNVLMAYGRVKHRSVETYVVDYECSVGVGGTGFWRAPEILEQVQRRVPACEMVFTKEADIYSFGMMCYEVITGCIPFDGYLPKDYSMVLRGERPHLPDNDLNLKKIIEECWHQDPQCRPSASTLRDRLNF